MLRTPEQAGAYVRKLRQLLRHVGASDGNMNEGSLRCDVNVSIHRINEPFGTRCEIKNLNSVKFMMHAIDYEIRRQFRELSQGRIIEPSTLGFNEATGETYVQRQKEEMLDYRFMPEPNVAPLEISPERIEALNSSLPEMPDARHARLREQYGLSIRDVNVLTRLNAEDDASEITVLGPEHAGRTSHPNAVDYFEALAHFGCEPQVAANWTIHLLPKYLGQAQLTFSLNPVGPAALAELLHILEEQVITRTCESTTSIH